MLSIKPIPPGRRFAIATLASLLAALLLHSQIAIALVTRGDEFLARGDVGSARRYYLRAMSFDHNVSTTVDRFAFSSLEQRTPASLREGALVASSYLLSNPHDASILADRALCYQILRKYNLAAADFKAAASASRSARYYTFAGWASYRMGNRVSARQLWKKALTIDRLYSPAIGALRKTVQ
ncbi:MAG: hypothetical protein NVSMB31_03770 [Vulcanimicrobiaceae bacterium]